MRRPTKFMLALLMALVGNLSANAHDFEAVNEGVTIYYKITSEDDLTCAVSYQGDSSLSYDDEYSGVVVIPSSVEYNGKTYSVTAIGGFAFHDCSSLTSVTIPNSVTSIGENAFWDCSGLTSIEIPCSVVEIGVNPFRECNKLKEIKVLEGGHFLVENDCLISKAGVLITGLNKSSVEVPYDVSAIGGFAFSGCSALTSISIPNSVTSIGGSAFSYCSGLTSINIPNSVTSIGEYNQEIKGETNVEIISVIA